MAGLLFFSVVCFVVLWSSVCTGADIVGPEVRLENNDLYVTARLALNEKTVQELRNGITKEFIFYIDLFKVWKMWPDEFVLNKTFTKTLKSDPVKTEYVATSRDESTQIRKRFKTLQSMIEWGLTIDNLKLAGMRDIEPATYFVRVTVESKIRTLPPVIGYFMIFLPENEFRIKKDSQFFTSGQAR